MLTETYIEKMRPPLVSEEFVGKTFSVLGDSISTFSQTLTWTQKETNYNGSATSYYSVNGEHKLPSYLSIWWGYLITQLGMEIVSNNSWGGREVSNGTDGTRYHNVDGSGSAAFHQKEIDALKQHKKNFGATIEVEGQSIDGRDGIDKIETPREEKIPDFILIRMGINDFNSGVSLGDYDGTESLKKYNYTPIQEKTRSEYSNFSFAYATMLDRIMTTYPKAQVYCCTLSPCNLNTKSDNPETDEDEALLPYNYPVQEKNKLDTTLKDWNNRIKQLAQAFGAKIINQENCGINYFNFDKTMIDHSSIMQGLHPNELGHKMMGEAAVRALLYN